jgi:hypothetical protein
MMSIRSGRIQNLAILRHTRFSVEAKTIGWRAIRDLPHVWIFDNDDLRTPFRQVAVFENG